MTEIEFERPPASTNTNSWDAAFAALKARFPKAKDSIIFAIHALQSDPDIALDDLKARAHMHGIRVTAASVRAAKRLMAPSPSTKGEGARRAASPEASKPPRTRRARAAQATVDIESLIRTTVGKIEKHGAVEAERLREAIRKTIAMLGAALGE